MFVAALFTLARTWKQPRSPSADVSSGMTVGSSEGEAGLIREGPASVGVHLPDSVSVADVCAFVCSSSISGSNS